MQVTASKCKMMGRWRSWWLRRQYKIKLVVVGRSMTRPCRGRYTIELRLCGFINQSIPLRNFGPPEGPQHTTYPTCTNTRTLWKITCSRLRKQIISLNRSPASLLLLVFWEKDQDPLSRSTPVAVDDIEVAPLVSAMLFMLTGRVSRHPSSTVGSLGVGEAEH